MSNERRFDRPTARPEHARGARYQSGGDRYRTGNEQRYWPERDRPGASHEGGGFEGDRRYGQTGYREETGYREFDNTGWGNADQDEQYFGTGSHYGGGFGTAPGSRASSAGTLGASGYAAGGAWSDPADWTPEDRNGTDTPSHRGRGPKGYLRSDERLREAICDRLTDDPRIDASEIEVDVKGQTVTLRGAVDDRRTKYAVEELVEGCGAREIENQLRVTQKGW
jgi:osmotically-inducible protein OsmY